MDHYWKSLALYTGGIGSLFVFWLSSESEEKRLAHNLVSVWPQYVKMNGVFVSPLKFDSHLHDRLTITKSSSFAFGSRYVSHLIDKDTDELNVKTKWKEASNKFEIQELDPDFAQQIQRLSKKDPKTRIKSLEALHGLTERKSVEELKRFLVPWSCIFRKLLDDPSREVRYAAILEMGALAERIGRLIAPYVKKFVPWWFLAQYDSDRDIQVSAKESFENTFPGPKKAQAVLYCHEEVT